MADFQYDFSVDSRVSIVDVKGKVSLLNAADSVKFLSQYNAEWDDSRKDRFIGSFVK